MTSSFLMLTWSESMLMLRSLGECFSLFWDVLWIVNRSKVLNFESMFSPSQWTKIQLVVWLLRVKIISLRLLSEKNVFFSVMTLFCPTFSNCCFVVSFTSFGVSNGGIGFASDVHVFNFCLLSQQYDWELVWRCDLGYCSFWDFCMGLANKKE